MPVRQIQQEPTSKRNLSRAEPGFSVVLSPSVWVSTRAIFNQSFTMICQEVLKTMCKRLEEPAEMADCPVVTCSWTMTTSTNWEESPWVIYWTTKVPWDWLTWSYWRPRSNYISRSTSKRKSKRLRRGRERTPPRKKINASRKPSRSFSLRMRYRNCIQ